MYASQNIIKLIKYIYSTPFKQTTTQLEQSTVTD